MYIVNDYLDTYGGSTTLLLRMGKWIKEKNEKFKIYTPKVGNKEIVEKLKLLGVQIEVFDTNNHSLLKEKIVQDLKNEQCIYINFILRQYIDVERIKKENKLTFVNVLYAIHPDTLLKGLGYSNKFAKRIIKSLYKPLILKIAKNNNLISMDQDIIDRTEEYYKFSFNNGVHIQLLPMIIPNIDVDATEENIKNRYNYKTIVSACRADFPYKGYVFGLIDDFVKLHSKYDGLSLELVCSGEKEDLELLRKKINELDNSCVKKINFHSWMDYDKLLGLFDKCYLAIGMGTMVVDAAINALPSIAVKYNTYENIANCIFSESPKLLVGTDGLAIDVIQRLLDMNLSDYEKISIECYESVKKYYNIDDFFDYINSLSQKKSFLSSRNIFLHKINNRINSKKENKEYCFSNIEKEDES